MDRVNVMELVAFTCIGWTCVLVLIQEDWTEFAQQFKALGVLFLGISQSMAILRMSSVFGPLVSMTMNMIVDMIQWWMLLIPIIGCLVAALITLFKTQDTNLGAVSVIQIALSSVKIAVGQTILHIISLSNIEHFVIEMEGPCPAIADMLHIFEVLANHTEFAVHSF